MGLLRNVKSLMDLVLTPQRRLEEVGKHRHLEALRDLPRQTFSPEPELDPPPPRRSFTPQPLPPPPGPPRTVHYMSLKVDDEACSGCGACAGICPMDAVAVDSGLAVVDQAQCAACGACIPSCPEDALDIVEG